MSGPLPGSLKGSLSQRDHTRGAGLVVDAAAVARFQRVRKLSETLSKPLQVEDFVLQAAPQASPSKWHLAHVSWFFETFLLQPFLPGYQAFQPAYRYLFNSYYDQISGGYFPRHQRGLLSRPTVAEVFEYRAHIDHHMARLLADPGEYADQVALRLNIGINHEQQHQELLLTDIKYNLSVNPLNPAYCEDLPTAPAELSPSLAARSTWSSFDGGLVEIGHQDGGFGFDNEWPRHRQYLQPYRLANRLVSNAEYLQFIEDGGYAEPAHWLSDGWAAVQQHGWQAPLYWRQQDGAWWTMTLGGLRPLQLSEPVVHISYYEAEAYAAWAGHRLPSEAEWEHAADGVPAQGNFLDQGYLHPQPPSGDGLAQMFGDVWEWTGSAYRPYPGYRVPKGAIGEYNGKFMSNQMVLRGGSCVTSADHIRASYRNFFYPHERWQFMGLRLAEDA